MDLVVSNLFLNHNIDDGFPSIKGEVMPNGIVNELNMGSDESSKFVFKDVGFN
jgi:hypothetical protein